MIIYCCRTAQQGKDWDSFQLMCKTLKSRDSIDDERELTSMWEQLDNCLRTLGLRGETHWYLRCKGGEQHSTIRSFVTEWKASKERKPWPETSHDRYISCASPHAPSMTALQVFKERMHCNAMLSFVYEE